MDFELVPIQFNKMLQSRSYTAFILGTKEKQFAIYTLPYIGQHIQTHLEKQPTPRPYVYDLITSIFKGLNIILLQVVITDVQDTTYFARLFVKQIIQDQHNILELDARPSDCLALAIENNIPIYCTKDVFDRVVALEE